MEAPNNTRMGWLARATPQQLAEHVAKGRLLTPSAIAHPITVKLRHKRDFSVLWAFCRGCRDGLAMIGLASLVAGTIHVFTY